MKKKALIGFTALLVLLVVCFFFSGTIKTLTTPKVMMVYPQQGRLKEQIPVTGFLTFSTTEDMTLMMPEGTALTITSVHVAPGMAVQKGDVLFETQFSGVEALIAAQEQLYSSAQTELLALEKQHRSLRLQRNDEAWLSAYDALVATYDARHDAQIQLKVATSLQSDVSEAQAIYDEAQLAVDAALSTMNKANRFTIADEAYSYTMQRRKLETQMEAATAEIVTLRTLQQRTRQICAPHSGYVTAVHITAGQTWDGHTPALTMSGDSAEMLLRADVSGIPRNLGTGSAVTVNGRFGKTVKVSVTATGYDNHGNPYVEASLARQDATALDTIAYLLREGTTMQISYTAASSAYLLPASAVRGSGENRSVYEIEESENAFGQTMLTIKEQKVTVLDESSDMVAVSEIIDNTRIAYMEDRPISPGSEVMAYE